MTTSNDRMLRLPTARRVVIKRLQAGGPGLAELIG